MLANKAFTQQQFEQNYRIMFNTPIGSGLDAQVYQVRDMNMKTYALKVLKYTSETNAINFFIIAFKNEINILVHIDHPSIIHLYGYCDDGSCILLEYLANGSLFKLAELGPFPKAIANGLILQMVEALRYLHQNNITHGDIKLDNLLVSDTYQVKLCDFGFGRKNGKRPIEKNTISGSRGYTAPEIYGIPQDYGKCDIFSLGVVYFILVTGHPPFISNDPLEDYDEWWQLIANDKWDIFWKELNLNLPQEMKICIQKFLSANPNVRITLDEVAFYLKDLSATDEQIQQELQKRVILAKEQND